MSVRREYRNLALVGFMGAGKTTVGGILAHLLQYEFLDTDRIIETREHRRITEIFATDGEAHFRQKETALCHELEGVSGKVISAGGGLVLDPANLESLRRHALVICLWASPETIYARLKHQTQRPLLQTSNPLATIRELMERRASAYQKADVLVGVDFRSPGDTARHIAKAFRRAQAHPDSTRFGASNPATLPALALPAATNHACSPPAASAISRPS